MIPVVILLSLYVTLLLVLTYGWAKASFSDQSSDDDFRPFISVLVPFRNEEHNITAIISDLAVQTYSNYEVVLINDHSIDKTLDRALAKKHGNVIVINNEGFGKKAALETGVARAKGEIILTTDADCRLQPCWIETMRNTFNDPKVKFSFGAVGIQTTDHFFSKLQAIEFASLVGSGAATSALKFPTMCNGANLGYRKDAFIAVNGFEGNLHIASGDDEFLMRKIQREFPNSIRFNSNHASVVHTGAQETIKQFFTQRIRWAGKWRHNNSPLTGALAILVLLSQFAVIASIAMLILRPVFALGILLAAKFALEAIFISRVCTFTNVRWSWWAFFTLQLSYPFYVAGVGLVSNFVKVAWKGRQAPNA